MGSSSGTRSRGRGLVGALGFVLLVGGLVGAGVLFFLSTQRPSTVVEGFARAAPGCRTTLDFADVGTYYVYEELVDESFEPTEGCDPTATPGAPFSVRLSGPSAPSTTADASISYDTGGHAGTSVQRFVITEVGQYELSVDADDTRMIAAVGRDPEEDVADLRRWAVVAGAVGALLGLLLLVLAGRRSRRAATPSIPDGPGWGPRPQPAAEWPPAAPTLQRVPINPQKPDTPAEFKPPPPPLPARERGAGLTPPSWGPPAIGQEPVSAEAPEPPPPPRAPQPMPVLPDAPGSVSGDWPPGRPPPPPPPPPPPKR